jgi:hypothetical protein
MQDKETYQLIVIISMLFINMLKTFGMYYVTKQAIPDTKFNSFYIISAVLGVFIGYSFFLPDMTYSGTYIDTFMNSGKYAIGANLLVDLTGKLKSNSEK